MSDAVGTARYWVLMPSETYGPVVAETTNDRDRADAVARFTGYEIIDRGDVNLWTGEPVVLSVS